MKIAVIGLGVAGVNAATTVRKISSITEISIYTDEEHFYYPRPRLYEIITGEEEPQNLYSFKPEFYETQRIKVSLKNKVVGIDARRKEITLEDGSRTDWDRLLLANGARPFIPSIEGVEKAGVFTLRTVADALAIREHLKKTKKAIVIGGGLLGLEVAAHLRKTGRQVDVLAKYSQLMPKQLDQDGSEMLRNDLERLGINPVLDATAAEISGNHNASGVLLKDGRQLRGNLIIIAAGIRSNIELPAEAGVRVEKGAIVDRHLQTNLEDVYAAGDIAEFNGQVYGIIPPALEQARIASLNMLGNNEHVYKGTIHTTTLRIADVSLTSMGLVNPQDSKHEEIKKVDKQEGVYKKIVLDQGRIVGAIFLGEKAGVTAVRRLMEQKANVAKFKSRLLERDFNQNIPWTS